MKKIAAIVIGLTIISKILGFGREVALSYFFGASNVSDAFIIAFTIPTFVFSIIGTGLAASYIPMYINISSSKGVNTANQYTNNLINIISVISLLLIFITMIFTGPIIKLFASGFDESTFNLAVTFTRISVLGILFLGVGYILRSNLQIYGNFIAPSLIGLPFNLSIIVSIVLSFYINVITILPVGITVGFFLQLIILIPFLRKISFTWNWKLNVSDPYIKQMIFLSLPVIIGVSANEINFLIDRTLASRIAIGGISSLNYAFTVVAFIQGVFSMTLVNLIYPSISKMAVEKNYASLKDTVLKAINKICIIIIPSTVGMIIFSRPIVSLLFGRGAFDYQAVMMTSNALMFYSIGVIGIGVREVLFRVFFALKDTKTPMVNAAIAMLLNIALNLILSQYMGVSGLALATSLSAIFCCLLLLVNFRNKLGGLRSKGTIILIIKTVLSSIIMGLVAVSTYNLINTCSELSENISLIVSVCVSVFTYISVACLLKVEEVKLMISLVRSKMKIKISIFKKK